MGRATERVTRARDSFRRFDADPRALERARRLRGILPGDSRYGDPLSTTGRTPDQLVGRALSALEPPGGSTSREIGLGALQVWQALSESRGRGRGERAAAILFTDLVGFSSWALHAGDEVVLDLLRQTGVALEGAVKDHDGKVVKRLGDGVMAIFTRPQDAVDAAHLAQSRLREVEVDGYRPAMRAGVHYGWPRKLGGDYLGVDVNVAARVADAAEGGQVLVSEPACEKLERGTHGRRKRLRAPGTPKDLGVYPVAPDA